MKRIPLTVLIICLASIVAYSQCDSCDKALQRDYIYLDYSSSNEVHLLDIITIENFDLKKTEESRNTSYAAAYKVYSGMMKSSNTYSDFHEKRSAYFNKIEFKSNKEESIKHFQNKMSALGYNSFDNCVKRCLKKDGVHLTVEEDSDCEVILMLSYIAAPGSHKVRYKILPGSIDISNGTANLSSKTTNNLIQKGINLTTGSEISLVFKRSNTGPLTVTINGLLNDVIVSTNIKLLPRTTFKEIKTEKKIISTLVTDSNCTMLNCLGLSNISDVKILSFEAAGRTSDHPQGGKCYESGFIADSTHSSFKTLQFGSWRNDNCHSASEWDGNGWHCNVGSCCREGNQVGKVNSVKVEVTYYKVEFIKVPSMCN